MQAMFNGIFNGIFVCTSDWWKTYAKKYYDISLAAPIIVVEKQQTKNRLENAFVNRKIVSRCMVLCTSHLYEYVFFF